VPQEGCSGSRDLLLDHLPNLGTGEAKHFKCGNIDISKYYPTGDKLSHREDGQGRVTFLNFGPPSLTSEGMKLSIRNLSHRLSMKSKSERMTT